MLRTKAIRKQLAQCTLDHTVAVRGHLTGAVISGHEQDGHVERTKLADELPTHATGRDCRFHVAGRESE
jgi:hypothetical protein